MRPPDANDEHPTAARHEERAADGKRGDRNWPSDGRQGAPPPWTPPGFALDDLPAALRAAVDEVVRPAHEQLVRAAEPGMERSIGITIVQLMWMEVLDQWELPSRRQPLAESGEPLEPSADSGREKIIQRHLRRSAPSCGPANVRRLQQFKQRCDQHRSRGADRSTGSGAAADQTPQRFLGSLASGLRSCVRRTHR